MFHVLDARVLQRRLGRLRQRLLQYNQHWSRADGLCVVTDRAGWGQGGEDHAGTKLEM